MRIANRVALSLLLVGLAAAGGSVTIMLMTDSNASEVWIGKAIPPDALKTCQAIVNMMQDLGTDPTTPDLAAGLALLDAGTASVLKFDQTNVPADLCTVGGKCGTVGATICAKKNLGLDESKIHGGVCLVKCADLALPDNEREPIYWVGLACP